MMFVLLAILPGWYSVSETVLLTDEIFISILICQVALKTLIVIHRALREADPSFRDELISYGRSSGHMLHMSCFKDGSSAEGTSDLLTSCWSYHFNFSWHVAKFSAWDHSAWVRNYALFLEERLESYRVLNYDVEVDPLVCI
jgi:hypothetical protein